MKRSSPDAARTTALVAMAMAILGFAIAQTAHAGAATFASWRR